MAIDRRQLLDAVRALDLPAGEYAVFGSGPLVVRDLRTGGDIDLVVIPELYERLKTSGWQVRVRDDGGETLALDDFDAMRRLEFPGYHGDIPALIAGAEWIDGVPFVSLDDLRVFKTAFGRAKDHVDLDLIDQATQTVRTGAPSAADVAHARAVLARHEERSKPPAAEPWHGTGWHVLAGIVTRPGPTFAAARRTVCWGTAYVVLLVSALLLCVAAPLHGGSAAWVLFAPVAAGIALVLALIVGRLAMAVAARAGGDGVPAAVSSQTGIVLGLCSLPEGVAALVAGDGPARTVVWLVLLPVGLGLLALLYARSLDVSYGRGLLAAIAGYLGAIAALILAGIVAVLAVTLVAGA